MTASTKQAYLALEVVPDPVGCAFVAQVYFCSQCSYFVRSEEKISRPEDIPCCSVHPQHMKWDNIVLYQGQEYTYALRP
jgi:hypothetical protein